jgi:hypothetical protein
MHGIGAVHDTPILPCVLWHARANISKADVAKAETFLDRIDCLEDKGSVIAVTHRITAGHCQVGMAIEVGLNVRMDHETAVPENAKRRDE